MLNITGKRMNYDTILNNMRNGKKKLSCSLKNIGRTFLNQNFIQLLNIKITKKKF